MHQLLEVILQQDRTLLAAPKFIILVKISKYIAFIIY